jgi:adenylate cyclase
MANIFISYSSKDREKAQQLTELLASAGLSVWIDKSGIEAATSWSEEIVNALDACKAFVVMLSPSSIESKNVVREVALAFEKNKKILPLDLEPVTLPASMQYHLAGIQRTSMTNIDAIIRAIGKLGLEATQSPTLKLVKETDSRKSLMILPFEDLSPTADNEWFANGIVNELISALSNIKALHVTDQQTTKEFKSYKGKLTIYAKEMSIRYFVQGDVRKFGDQIKISSRLLDIETGDHLWQDSLKGTMDDIFDIQELVAKKVTEGLSFILTKDEVKKIEQKPTENSEAYELNLKANGYFERQTKSDHERALTMYEEATRLDPKFITAYVNIANTCVALYQNYLRSPELLDRAEVAAKKILELEGKTVRYLRAMSVNALQRSDAEGALQLAKEVVEKDPLYAPGYLALAFAFRMLNKKREMIEAYKAFVHLRPDDRTAHWGLANAVSELGDTEQLREAGKPAIPLYERYVRLNPDDYHAKALLAAVLRMGGMEERAIQVSDELSEIDTLDALTFVNIACVYLRCNLPDRGMELLKKGISRGYKNIEHLRTDPDLDPLRGMPEFEGIMRGLEGEANG